MIVDHPFEVDWKNNFIDFNLTFLVPTEDSSFDRSNKKRVCDFEASCNDFYFIKRLILK